ncbi:MAG TPA: phosphoglucosamine mutase [Acidimicrobiia bacterium]|nr:phosphoglucosamine mutase [Acidimicrobiia bacterium]
MLRFGTDGVRGDAGADLTSDLVVAFGRAVARTLYAPRILIGRDTRESGPRIESELVLGVTSEGTDAALLGVVPTPAIAFAAAAERSPALIISASHNPWSDNGVKVIGADGRKLPDRSEAAIERELHALIGEQSTQRASASTAATGDKYVAHLASAVAARGLAGMRVALDCANGAAFEVGPRALAAVRADATVIHDEPDGRNINEACGSTHPESLQQCVVESGAAIGLALDGDGDRVIAVDEHGRIVDGDQIMTMIAIDLHQRGMLRNDAIAVTVMSNLGLRRALEAAGIAVIETPVGDRAVVEAMREHDLVLGGEQSGHVVFAEHATTGDGLLTGLLVCDLLARTQRRLSELAAQMTRFPQVLVSVRVANRGDLVGADGLQSEVRAVESELGAEGRVLVRASGTEPVVRVMVEAADQARAEAAVARLCRAVESEFGSQ